MEEMIPLYIFLKVIWKNILKPMRCKKIINHQNTFKITYSNFSMKKRCLLIDGFS